MPHARTEPHLLVVDPSRRAGISDAVYRGQAIAEIAESVAVVVLLEELREVIGPLLEAQGLVGELTGALHEALRFGTKFLDRFFGLGTLGIFWHLTIIRCPRESGARKRGVQHEPVAG